jgi:uncharacterized membrane protein (UPF0127 family)
MEAAVIGAVVCYAAVLSYLFLYKNAEDYADAEIRSQNGPATRIHLEVANTIGKRARGLMYRESLPEDRGMLFVFSFVRRPTFWMKNTSLPLDILFIGEDLHIADLRKNTVPLSREKIKPTADCRYVIEVNAGFCRRFGIEVGDIVTFLPGGITDSA